MPIMHAYLRMYMQLLMHAQMQLCMRHISCNSMKHQQSSIPDCR